MKKNKKQLKREKKNLRRLNEMKRIQKLTEMSIKNSTAENIAVRDFGIDQYGNATHRINEKGVVDSSVTEMFGCEIEKSIPEFVRSFSDKMGLGEFIRVPIRKNGLTSSGNYARCHQNVGSLVDWKGGTMIGGYQVSFYKDDGTCTFHHHHVWVNPEGNISCVTGKNYDPEINPDNALMTEDTVLTKGNKDYVLFLPVSMGCWSSIGWKVLDATIWTNWRSSGIGLADTSNGNNPSWIPTSFDQIRSTSLVTNRSGNVKFARWDDTDKKRLRLEYLNLGGFSKPSLATGKSWNEIQSELRAVA